MPALVELARAVITKVEMGYAKPGEAKTGTSLSK